MLCKFLLITSFGKTEAYAGLSSCLMSWTRPITGAYVKLGRLGCSWSLMHSTCRYPRQLVRATGGFSRARAFDVHAI